MKKSLRITLVCVVSLSVSVMGCGADKEDPHAGHAHHDHSAQMHEEHADHAGHAGHKAHADTDSLVLQTTCPVMGGAINKELYVDHEGKRIYVCCGGCIDQIKQDPQKYIDKLKADGQKPWPVEPEES